MEMFISGIIALGTLHLIGLAIIILGLLFSVGYGSGVWTLILFAGLIGFFEAFASIGLIAAIQASPMFAVKLLGLYLFIGLFWSMFRLYRKVRLLKSEYEDKEVPAYKLEAKYHKEDIFFWLTTWMLDIPMYFLFDMLTDLARKFWKYLGGIYQRVIDFALKG